MPWVLSLRGNAVCDNCLSDLLKTLFHSSVSRPLLSFARARPCCPVLARDVSHVDES